MKADWKLAMLAALLLADMSAQAAQRNIDPKLAKARAAFEALQLRDESGTIKPNGLAQALQQRRQAVSRVARMSTAQLANVLKPVAGVNSAGWTALGPGNVGGRTLAIVAHPTVTGKLWAGTAGGGIWVTTNSGASWQPVNDFMGSLAVQSMAIDPNNPNTMYAGTGEGFNNGDAQRGVGLFQSTDGGVTWNVLPSTIPSTTNPNWYYVTKVAVMPGNSSVILAATASDLGGYAADGFIYRSTDGGTSWTQVYTNSASGSGNHFWGLAFDPNNASKVACGDSYGGVVYSADGGVTWTRKVVAAGAGRVEVAYAKSSSNTLYAHVDHLPGSAGSGQVYQSTDGGATWTLKGTPADMDQGWYANAIWVDPTNSAHLVVGGLDLWQSIDSGASWTQISNWTLTVVGSSTSPSPHADHHVLVSDPAYNGTSNLKLYDGDDGGVYSAATITTATTTAGWTALNTGFAVTQLYSAAGSTAAANRIVTGAQDNGALTYTGSGTNWTEWSSGDGGFSAVGTNDLTGNTFYGSYVYLTLYRTQDGGTTAPSIYSGITDANANANFISPFILDPNNAKRMLAGGLSLWQTTDATAATPVWTNIYDRSTFASAGDYISAITVAQGNPNLIWIGTNYGTVAYTTTGTTATPTWTAIPAGKLPGRYVARILVDKNNAQSVYVSFGGYTAGNLYHSTDGGATWTNITGTLPAVPIRTITMHPTNSSWLYAGTDVGIYTSEDGGTTWNTTNDGPANVRVDELSWMDNSTLLAATHGRGMFKMTVQTAVPAAPQGVAVVPANAQDTISWTPATGLTYNIYYSTSSGVTPATGTKIANVSSPYVQSGLTDGTTYYYVVTAVNAVGESAASTETSATPIAPPAAPTGVQAVAGNTQNTISWTTVSGATSYNIYWSNTAGVTIATGTKIANASTTGSYIHAGLTNGTAYHYVVTAVNAGGESVISTEVSATPAAPASGGGGGGGCSIMAPGGNPDVSLLLSVLMVALYWVSQRRRVREEG